MKEKTTTIPPVMGVKQAATYLDMKLGTFRYYIYTAQALKGRVFGECLVFTKHQLDVFQLQHKAMGGKTRREKKNLTWLVVPFPDNVWFGWNEAIAYTGLTVFTFRKAIEEYRIPKYQVATSTTGALKFGVVLFNIADLDRIKLEKSIPLPTAVCSQN